MAQLREELVVVVTANQVVRHRDPDRCRDRERGIGPLREALEAVAHQRDDTGQSWTRCLPEGKSTPVKGACY